MEPKHSPKQSLDDLTLRADHLRRTVPGKVLLDDVSFEVARGETLAIAGPSGSGKSTLLRLLNRLDEPSHGTVFLDGQDYKQIPPRELRRRVGMVTQRPFLFPGTVADNLMFGPTQLGESLSEAEIDRLLKDVGLASYGSRDVANLSGGEAQRVSFARTLANGPEILLLDEPTSALDDGSKRGIEALIMKIMRPMDHGEQPCEGANIFRQPSACLLVTHDMGQAARLAKRVLILAGGRIVKAGPVREVLNVEDTLP
jgi:putative ABC transport system ATP-binding protein